MICTLQILFKLPMDLCIQSFDESNSTEGLFLLIVLLVVFKLKRFL
jgi:hypothetical protein